MMNLFKGYILIVISLIPVFCFGQEQDTLLAKKYEGMSLQELMNVEVKLGTRGEKRKIFDSPVPIDIITSDDLERSGYVSTGEALQTLYPSFNYVRSTITDGSDHVRASTLRGMGPDQVLVLINGKRRHNTALMHVNSTPGRGSTGVDLDAIPISIIERIEILRDGAAAQYGSDAIAGIINIVLRNNERLDIGTHYGSTTKGDGQVKYLSTSAGVKFLEKGNFNISMEVKEKEQINRAGPDTRQQYFDGDPRNNNSALNNLINHRVGEPEFSELSFFANASVPLEQYNFYFFGGINNRNSVAGGFYRRALDNRNVRAIYPDGFLPLIAPKNTDLSLTAGVNGETHDWNWDFSIGYGSNTFKFNVENSVNVSLGTNSPKDFYAGALFYSQYNINLDLNKSVNLGLKEDMNLGLGLEFRNERYQIQSGEEASYINGGVPIIDGPNQGNNSPVGAQVFPGFSPVNETDKSRMATSAYIDAEQQIKRRISLGLALRYERNYEFGETLNGKLTLRYQPSSSLAFRSSISTGYRTPSLAQSYFTSTATIFAEDRTPYQVGTFSVDHPLAQSLGAQELQPEESRHFSAGVIIEPLPNMMVSFDGFYVGIDKRIVLSGDFTNNIEEFGTEIANLLEDYNISGARFLTNAINTQSYGFDLVFNYNTEIAKEHSLETFLGIHQNTSRLKGDIMTPDILKNYSNALFTREEQSRLESSQPNHNINLRFVHTFKKLESALKFAWYGGTQSEHHSDASRDEVYTGKLVTYANISYEIVKNLKLSVGGNNIFNTMPDPKKEINNFGGLIPYNFITQYGVGGSYFYISIKHSI